MSVPKHLLITANSPGEIAGWARAIVYRARQRWPQTRITVILLPCSFASGSERRVALEQLHVDEVIPSSRYFRLLLGGLAKYREAVLVHLGGDLMYAAALAWAGNLPTWSYQWGRWWWDKAFRGYFVKDTDGIKWLRRHSIPAAKAAIVGDLVSDSVASTLEQSILQGAQPPKAPAGLVTFMPGSRQAELSALSPFFLQVAEKLQTAFPGLEFQMLISPFIEKSKLKQALESPPWPGVGGLTGTLSEQSLRAGTTAIRLVQQHHMLALAQSSLAITIPGTKTAEAAVLKVPQLVILPLNRPELLPYGGLLGLLDMVPYGKYLKGRLLLLLKDKLHAKLGYVAQPNILAGKRIVPELVGNLTVQQVAEQAQQLLDDPHQLQAQRDAFVQLYSHSHGAADRILEKIESSLQA